MKKTICMISDWYPTKENPFRGVFFKEQAYAVSEHFDFLIIRYYEHLRKKPWQHDTVTLQEEDQNTAVYQADLYFPVSVYLADLFKNFYLKQIRKISTDGVGEFASAKRRKHTEKAITRIFEKYFKDRFDALYCVDAQNEAYILRCVSRHFHKPYLVAEHGPVPWPGHLIRDINREAIEEADGFLAISQDKIRQLLLQNIRLPETTYIGNMVDETQFTIGEKTNSIPTFVIVAAHTFYKNYDLFIAVMNRLTEITDRDFRVKIVGYASNKGYSRDADVLEQKIRDSAFTDRAELIPAVPHEKLQEVYWDSDVFIMTSIQEGQPVSAMEAACCGLPVFSTRCGGVEDYVDDTMGRIYAVTDAEGMAQGLKDYLEGKIWFDRKHIRETVSKCFGREAFVQKYIRAFNKVINNA